MSKHWQQMERWLQREILNDPDCLSCTRASRSLGPWDLCAVMKDETWFIQIKASRGSKVPGLVQARADLEPLSGSWLHRMCWIVVILHTEIRWQGFLDPENESGKRGWYHYPDGPFGQIGEKVKLREVA